MKNRFMKSTAMPEGTSVEIYEEMLGESSGGILEDITRGIYRKYPKISKESQENFLVNSSFFLAERPN